MYLYLINERGFLKRESFFGKSFKGFFGFFKGFFSNYLSNISRLYQYNLDIFYDNSIPPGETLPCWHKCPPQTEQWEL